MSDFNPTTDLPPAIRGATKLEKILLYCILTLGNLYRAVTYQELQNALPEKVIDFSIVQAADGSYRVLFRGSMPLDPGYITSTNSKLWNFAQEWGTTAVPAAYKVD